MPFGPEGDLIKNPEFYQQKANQLRIQNQILRRQLENNTHETIRSKPIHSNKNFNEPQTTVNYTFQKNIPPDQAIYNRVSEPIGASSYYDRRQSFQSYLPQNAQIHQYEPEKQLRYKVKNAHKEDDYCEKNNRNDLETQIIELQTKGYRLERQINRLSSFIKEDLRDFIRDSNVHKQCSYKEKYIRAITNRPRYFKFYP